MPRPAPAWLSLLEAVQFVVEDTCESEDRVREVLTGAGLMGTISRPDAATFRATKIWQATSPIPFLMNGKLCRKKRGAPRFAGRKAVSGGTT